MEEYIPDSEEERGTGTGFVNASSLPRDDDLIEKTQKKKTKKKEKEEFITISSSSSSSSFSYSNLDIKRQPIPSTSHWFPSAKASTSKATTTSPTKTWKTKSPPIPSPSSSSPRSISGGSPALKGSLSFPTPHSSTSPQIPPIASTSTSVQHSVVPKLPSKNSGLKKGRTNTSSKSATDLSASEKPLSIVTKTTTTGKRMKPWEEEEEASPEDVEKVTKMRASIAQFKYRDASIATSTTTTVTFTETVKEDESLDEYLFSKQRSSKIREPTPPPPPITLPPSNRVSALTTCPLCNTAWTVTKTLPTKSTHLKNCAQTLEYSTETVLVLVEDWILEQAKVLEIERRERDRNKSLFDRVVGKGEGSSRWREVEVVGVTISPRSSEGEGGAVQELIEDVIKMREESKKQVELLQKELEASIRREPIDKLVKVANEIKICRKGIAEIKKLEALALKERKAKQEEDMEEEEYWQDDNEGDILRSQVPRPSGRLAPHSTARKAAVAARAEMLLGDKGGTGLTQVSNPQPSLTKKSYSFTANSASRSLNSFSSVANSRPSLLSNVDAMEVDQDNLSFPPSTQIFEPSKLAKRLLEQGSVQGVLVPNKGNQRSLTPSITTVNHSDDDKSTSLWRAAAGNDTSVIERVVRSSSPLPTTASTLNLISSSSPGYSKYSYQSNPSSTLFLSSSPPDTPQIRHPHLFPSSVTPLSSSSNSNSNSSSPTPISKYIDIDDLSTDDDDDDDAQSGDDSLNESVSQIRTVTPVLNRDISLPLRRVLDLELNLMNQTLGLGDELDEKNVDVEMREDERGIVYKDRDEDGEGDGEESSGEEEILELKGVEEWEEWNDGEQRGDGMLIWDGADIEDDMSDEEDGLKDEEGEEEEEVIIIDKKEKKKSTLLVLDDTQSSPPKPVPFLSSSPSSSSDSEPSARVVGRKLKGKGKVAVIKSSGKPPPKPRSKKPAKSPPPPSEAQLLGAPDYNNLTTHELQSEVVKYGFKVSKERSVLVDQLEKVWLAITGSKGVVGGKRKKVKSKKAEEGEEGEVLESIEVRIRNLILADEKLYLRVLRYEPIFFEDFVTLVAGNGIKIARPILMGCLDDLCITIYTQDPAAGPSKPRTRHA